MEKSDGCDMAVTQKIQLLTQTMNLNHTTKKVQYLLVPGNSDRSPERTTPEKSYLVCPSKAPCQGIPECLDVPILLDAER